MVTFVIPQGVFQQCRRALLEGSEAVGFFAANYRERTRRLHAIEWRPVSVAGFENRATPHISLKDEAAAEIIKWAWDQGVSLIEVHSHGRGTAAFSVTDVMGLEEWVPHLFWRLGGRPYGAIVLGGSGVDALAWIDDARSPEQVESLRVGFRRLQPTGLTLATLQSTRADDG